MAGRYLRIKPTIQKSDRWAPSCRCGIRYLDGHDTAIIDLNVGKAITNLGAEGTDRLIKEIDKDVAWHPPPPGVSVRETGDSVVMTTVISCSDHRKNGDDPAWDWC